MQSEELPSFTAKPRVQRREKQPSDKERLLCNGDLMRWYLNLKRGSPATADQRLWKLNAFCNEHGFTPMEFVELAKKDVVAVCDTLADHINSMEIKNHAPSYIQSVITSIKSWLGHFNITIPRKLKVANAGCVSNGQCPTIS